MREALRHEHQNNEQQNLVRVAENLELTRELNLLRRKNTALGAEVTRLEAKIKVHAPTRARKTREHSFARSFRVGCAVRGVWGRGLCRWHKACLAAHALVLGSVYARAATARKQRQLLPGEASVG